MLYHFKKIKHDVLEYIPLLVEKLSLDGDIVALYLFGSYAEGRQTPVSDVDLAVLLERNFPRKYYFEKKLNLLSRVTSILKTDEVDLIVLNQAPPAFSYQVLYKGKLLFEKPGSKAQRVVFQVRTCDRYFDFKPVEKVIHQGLIRRIKEGKFGG